MHIHTHTRTSTTRSMLVREKFLERNHFYQMNFPNMRQQRRRERERETYASAKFIVVIMKWYCTIPGNDNGFISAISSQINWMWWLCLEIVHLRLDFTCVWFRMVFVLFCYVWCRVLQISVYFRYFSCLKIGFFGLKQQPRVLISQETLQFSFSICVVRHQSNIYCEPEQFGTAIQFQYLFIWFAICSLT